MARSKTRKPPTNEKVEEELSRCIIRLLHKEPFFGHLLAGVVREIGTVTPTAGVTVRDGRVRLMVNPEFFLRVIRAREERVGIVKHETLHLLFKHVLRLDPKRGHDPLLWNLAADLVVNQFIKRPWKLPDSAVTLKTFPDLGLEEDQSADWYYDKLAALKKEMEDAGLAPSCSCGANGRQPGSSGGGQAQGGQAQGGQPQGGQPQGQRGQSQGQSGPQQPGPRGEDGHPQRRYDDSDFDGLSAPESAKALARMGPWHSDHGLWGAESHASTETAETVIDGLVARTAERVGVKDWGNLPGKLKDLIQASIERRKPQVDWRRVVRIFSNSSRRTRVVSTHRRPSRRYGTFPGIRVRRMERLAVAVDTSGSVSDRELSVFFGEIQGMWRQGAEVHVFECDAAVQRSYLYRGKLPKAVAGRGGTRFDPVFEELRKDRMWIWDGCIYLTDGYAPAPQVKPPCKLLWVITAEGKTGEHLRWGRAVKLTNES